MSPDDRRKQLEILTTLTGKEARLVIEVLEDLIDSLARQIHFRRHTAVPSYKRDHEMNVDESETSNHETE